MAITKELFLAILAMDAYNRGYDSGIQREDKSDNEGLGESGSVGNARILQRDPNIKINDWQSAGFYALSYTISGTGTDLDGKTVISYRGTDAKFTPFGISGSDLVHGCGLGGACTGNR